MQYNHLISSSLLAFITFSSVTGFVQIAGASSASSPNALYPANLISKNSSQLSQTLTKEPIQLAKRTVEKTKIVIKVKTVTR